MLAQNRLGISHGFAWTGLEETSFPASVDASTLEAFKAYGSFLFGLHPTIFSRKALALVVQIVSFCTFYQAFCSITRHKHSVTAACVFFCVYILLIVPDIRKFSTVSFWVCRYPSQGKTLLSAIIYPALVFACAQIVECGREHIAWQKWAYLGLIFTAGIASTIVGVYWPFLCCLTMGLPYLLLERRKDFFKLLLPLFLVCLPVLVYAGLSYLTIATTPTEYFSYETPKWTDALAEGLNVWYLGILLPALVYTLMRGSKAAKLVVAGGCITLFLTFANPLLIGPVSRYLTTGNVYFRLFWMAPVYFLPAYAVAEIVGNRPVKRLKLSGAAVWLLSAALILSGGAGVVFARSTEVGRTITRGAVSLWNMLWDSPYNLSDPWEEAGSRMLEGLEEDERVRVVWLGEWDCFFRQYSERIELVGACRDRQWKYFDQPLEEGAVAPVVLHDDFFTEGNGQDFSDPVWAYEQLCASRVDYIGVRDDSAFARREEPPFGFEFFCESGGYVIYRIN